MDNRNFVEGYNRICDKQDSLKYAINIDNQLNILPVNASKSFNMECPGCKGKVIVCRSKNDLMFFRHCDNEKWCDYYIGKWNKMRLSSGNNKISETKKLIHNEAIEKMIDYLNSGKKINVNKRCQWNYDECRWLYPYEIKLEEGDIAVSEYTINETLKRADIAILNNEGNIKQIIEIFCTHKTLESNRPCDISWCELDAFEVLENIIADHEDYICQRLWGCDDCTKENIKRQEENDRKKRLQEQERKEQEIQKKLEREKRNRELGEQLALNERERQEKQRRWAQQRKEESERAEKERQERLAREEQKRLERLARAEQERLEWEATAPEREKRRLELIALEEEKRKQEILNKLEDDKKFYIFDIEDKIKSINVFINSLDEIKHTSIINNMKSMINDYKTEINEI